MAKKDEVTESMQRIWLAGLGALSTAGEEGAKLFKELVQRGEQAESASRESVHTTYSGARRGFDEAAGRARKAAEETWTKFGGGLDERLARTLHRIGVPTRDEISALSRRVEELTSALERMRQKEAAATVPPRSERAATVAGARDRAAAAKPPATAAKPATDDPVATAKRGAAKAAPPKPSARRVGAAPDKTPPAVPEKITTPKDVTTTADVKTGPR